MASDEKIRYAVVGIGSIAQEAILPAFAHAENAELAALVSGDARKREELGRRYGCRTYDYSQYDECLESGDVDGVYIALPNHLHRQYAEAAAKRGVHILCEKPLAQNEQECRAMIDAARAAGVKLMTAYRLHFEKANLEAVMIAESGKLGDLRIFHSIFCQQVVDGNVRLTEPSAMGGGPLFDMGVYCINAARYLFRDEPVEVIAVRGNNGEKRFDQTEEMMSVILRFPHDRLANFTVSFGAASIGRYTLAGTRGTLAIEPAYDYSADMRLTVSAEGQTREQVYPKRDQFAPEIVYFSQCILENKEPEPSGEEGLIDVQIVRAAYRAADSRTVVAIQSAHRKRRPEPSQRMERPAVEEAELVNARVPTGANKQK